MPMTISPITYIDTLINKLNFVANKQHTNKVNGKKIQEYDLSPAFREDLIKTRNALNALKTELPASQETTLDTYLTQIRITVATAYLKAYILGRKKARVWGRMSTVKNALVDAYEEAISNALDTLPNANADDNFLLPKGKNVEGKFEKSFLAYLHDNIIVTNIFDQLVCSLVTATDWQGKINDAKNKLNYESHLSICINVMKAIVRLHPDAYVLWNMALAKKLPPEATLYLTITLDPKTREPLNFTEEKIRLNIETLILKNKSMVQALRDGVRDQLADYVNRFNKQAGSAQPDDKSEDNTISTSSTTTMSSMLSPKSVSPSSSTPTSPITTPPSSPPQSKRPTIVASTKTIIEEPDLEHSDLVPPAAPPMTATVVTASAIVTDVPTAPPMAPPMDAPPMTSTVTAEQRNINFFSDPHRNVSSATDKKAEVQSLPSVTPAKKLATGTLSLGDQLKASLASKFKNVGQRKPDNSDDEADTAENVHASHP